MTSFDQGVLHEGRICLHPGKIQDPERKYAKMYCAFHDDRGSCGTASAAKQRDRADAYERGAPGAFYSDAESGEAGVSDLLLPSGRGLSAYP